MPQKVKFTHTNLIAKDWKKLLQFYIDVFGCKPIYPEKNLSGEWIEKVTKIPRVEIKGIHLKLPGNDEVVLEIFEVNKPPLRNTKPEINDYGFSHIAFAVEDVKAMLQKMIDHGGSAYGDYAEKHVPGVGILEVVYAEDPEGNIVELMNWKKE